MRSSHKLSGDLQQVISSIITDVSLTYHGIDHHFAERLVSRSQTLCHEEVLEKVRLATSVYSQYQSRRHYQKCMVIARNALVNLQALKSSILVLEPLLTTSNYVPY